MEDISESIGGPLVGDLPSLWDRFNASANQYPDYIALTCSHRPADLYDIPSVPLNDNRYKGQPYLRWTYKTLKVAISRLVGSLADCIVREGDPIFTFLPNGAEYVLAWWAADRLGSPFVPLNIRNLTNKDEIRHMIATAMSVNHSTSAIVFAESSEVARQVQDLGLDFSFKLVVAISDSSEKIQVKFSDLMRHGLKDDETPLNNEHKQKGGIVLFTSGTTSLPKGCLWRHPGFSFACLQRESLGESTVPEPGDVSCCVVPNNHAIGFISMLFSLGCGATLVYPGPSFVPQTTMDTMIREKCTHIGLVPVMVHALLSVKPADGRKLETLKSVFLGGSMVSPTVLRQCIEELGSKGVEHAFGMTEGSLLFSGCTKDWRELLTDTGEAASVGRAMLGQKLRICGAGTKTPVKRGNVGELHTSSPTVLSGYIGKESDDFYIGDDGKRWHATGDQAWMDTEGRVFISGRYKEMIIRGGENISPAAIQATLAKVPKLAALNVQIVKASDPIAGEVPVAIIDGTLEEKLVQQIQETILKNMGASFVPDEVLTLEVLGVTEYPKTMAGKIQMNKLAELVQKYREMVNMGSSDTDHAPKELEISVTHIWSKAIGYEVDIHAPLSNFADSITVMKARDQILKETGKNISLADMVDSETVAGQIEFLQNQPRRDEERRVRKRPIRKGPPGPDDIVHLAGDATLFRKTKAYIEHALSSHGLAWSDVEDVVPMYDFVKMISQMGIVDSWTFKITILALNKDAAQVRAALESTLANNRLLASFVLSDGKALGSDTVVNVLIRHQKILFDQCITNMGKLDSLKQLENISRQYHKPGYAEAPGPLFHAKIAEIEGTQDTGLIITVHHGVMDASAALLFSEDLDKALGGADLEEHVDYKLWADSYHSLRTSLNAKIATSWHVSRLKGLSENAKALLPPRGTGINETYEAVGIDSGNYIWCSFQAHEMPLLRREHANITAPVILKAAVALFNVNRTQHTHALFSNLEASRIRFPFVPKALELLEGQAFEAFDVAGPTFQAVVNLIEIKPNEPVLAFLKRIQQEQNELTKYAAAPLCDIVSSLGDQDGPMMLESLQTQIFNWVPGLGSSGTNPYSNSKALSAVSRSKVRLVCNAGLGGKNADTVILNLKGAAFDQPQLRKIAAEIEKITCWLTAKEHWKSSVGDFASCLTAAANGHACSLKLALN